MSKNSSSVRKAVMKTISPSADLEQAVDMENIQKKHYLKIHGTILKNYTWMWLSPSPMSEVHL